MIVDILIVLAAMLLVIIVLVVAGWWMHREPAGHGQHGARREHHRSWHVWPLAWKVRRDHPRNILLRLRAGEGLRDAVAARWAPPMTRTLAPLPVQADFYERDAVDDLIDAMNIPGGSVPAHTLHGPAGEPTNVARGYWQPNGKAITDVLPARVVAALNGARTDDTVVTHRDRQAWLDELVGGDPFDGLGSVDAYLDKLFYAPVRVA